MEEKSGERTQRFLKREGGKLDQGLGVLKRGGWNSITKNAYRTSNTSDEAIKSLEHDFMMLFKWFKNK